MARSYGIQYANAQVGNAGHCQLEIYMATAAGVRPKIYEFVLSSSATPADYVSRVEMARTSSNAPSGGAAPTIAPLDFADPTALASAYDSATGGDTLSTVLYIVSVNQRATYRWVAAPTKEFVIPNTQYAGAGLVYLAQSTAYYPDVSLFWEE